MHNAGFDPNFGNVCDLPVFYRDDILGRTYYAVTESDICCSIRFFETKKDTHRIASTHGISKREALTKLKSSIPLSIPFDVSKANLVRVSPRHPMYDETATVVQTVMASVLEDPDDSEGMDYYGVGYVQLGSVPISFFAEIDERIGSSLRLTVEHTSSLRPS